MAEEKKPIEEKPKEPIAKRLLTATYYMIFGNGPWLATVIYSIGLGYLIIPLFDLQTINLYARLTIPAIPLSIILTSWVQVIVTKKILDYKTLRKIVSAKALIKKSVLIVFAVNVLFFGASFASYYFIENIILYPDIIYMFFLTLALSLVWVGIAPLNGMQKYGEMTLFFLLGLSIGGFLTYYLALNGYSVYYLIVAQSLGYLIVAVGMYFYITFIVFKEPLLAVKFDRGLVNKILEKIGDERDGEKLAKLIPAMLKVREAIGPDDALVIVDKAQIIAGRAEKLRTMLRENTWLMAANMLYFLYIWLDRFFVWIFFPSSVQGLFIGINSVYESGINIAQWALIFPVGLVAYYMSDFTPRLLDSLRDLYTEKLDKIKASVESFKKYIISRMRAVILITTLFTVTINVFAEPLLELFKIYNETTLFILRISSVGVIFHMLYIYEFLVLMYLNRLKESTYAMASGVLAALIVGSVITLRYGFVYLALAYIACGVVASYVAYKKIVKVINNLPYEFISKALG
ncbi:MAG: exopolysaccharide Pel transporter PelG [Candidatus Asgardarchaeia archaeon]